jgi:hypothetical protein
MTASEKGLFPYTDHHQDMNVTHCKTDVCQSVSLPSRIKLIKIPLFDLQHATSDQVEVISRTVVIYLARMRKCT